MESSAVKLTVPHEVAFCRGRACDQMEACGKAGACGYQSSSDLYREAKGQTTVQADGCEFGKSISFVPINPAYAKDYAGTVTGTGVKGSMADPNKIPLSLIDPTFTDGVGRVLRYGAKKYKPGNWLNGMKWSEVISGIRRHLNAIETGEDHDPETGELHTYHAGCGIMFLSRYMSDPRYVELDDRLFKVKP